MIKSKIITNKGRTRLLINFMIVIWSPVIALILLELLARVGTYIYTGNVARLTHFEKFTPYKRIKLKNEIYNPGTEHYYKGIKNYSFKDTCHHCLDSPFITITYNSKGYRTPEFKIAKDKIRIATFGGSSTWGAGSNDDETWPSFLQKHLDQKLPNYFEVINSGFGGYNSTLIYNLIEHEFVKFKPDIAIIYSGYNDHTGAQPNIFFNNSNFWIKLMNMHFFLKSKSTLYFSADYYLKLGKKINIINRGNKNANKYENNINKIVEILKKNGTKKIVIVKQPLYVTSLIASSSAPGASFKNFFGNPYFNKETFETIHKAQLENKNYAKFGRTYYSQMLIYKKIDDIEKNNKDIVVLDFVNQMIKTHELKKNIFLDPVHLSPKANNLLAKNIVKNDQFQDVLRLVMNEN
jgi:lysophospholipase L1-like esterase